MYVLFKVLVGSNMQSGEYVKIALDILVKVLHCSPTPFLY